MRSSNRHLLISLILPAVLAAAAPRRAHADDWDEDLEEPYTAATWPTELVRRPLTLAGGMWEIGALVNVNLTKGEAADPISLVPSAAYGVTEKVTVTLSSTQGLCVTGGDHCPYVYNDLGAFVRWSALRKGPWEIALTGGIDAQQFQPDLRMDLDLRAAGRWRQGRLAVEVEPFVAIGMTDSDRNGTVVGVNGRPELQVTDRLALFGLVRLFGAVDDFSGTYLIHSGLGLLAGLGHIDVGAQVIFPALLGPNDNAFAGLGKLDQREAQVLVTVRF